jgi:tripartite-type tricarboxylate transporter receptor subunit TctC
VRIIIPFPASQATDTIARLMGQSLSERLGQPFIIENRTGAGGSIGTEVVVRATPDGNAMSRHFRRTGVTEYRACGSFTAA